ncbi:MAG: hypothetical protein SVM80_06315 [Halobacteriota archaeon]|nr:hypothetical protein [Halobacteriota archaeon]
MNLETKIKEIAIKAGAELVGITSKDRLMGHECSDPTYYLPSAESAIGFAVPLKKENIRDFLQKTELSAQRRLSEEEGNIHYKLEDIGDAIKDFLESKGYEAINCELNMDYRYFKRGGKRIIEQLKRVIELTKKNPDNHLVRSVKTGSIKFLNPNLTPKISLRYVGVACGVGRLGWSGNLVT